VNNETEFISKDADHDGPAGLADKPGARLKAAREVRGLTQEQIAGELYLSQRFMTAMEADSYKDLPAPAFVRGYMRRYAQLVKLPPDDIASSFDHYYAADTETPAPDERPSNPIQQLGNIEHGRFSLLKLLAWGGLIVIALLAAGFLWKSVMTHHHSSPAADKPAADATPALEKTAPITPPATALPAPSTSAPSTPAASATLPVMNALPALSAPAVPMAKLLPATTAAAPDSLTLTLKSPSWLSIRDKHQQFISALQPAGQLTLKGQAPFYINIGRASAVSLTLNGKSIDLAPYTQNEVATLTLKP
jgi:cytoskeleton protein RodZ